MLRGIRKPHPKLILPASWKEGIALNPFHRWYVRRDNLKVIITEELHEDDNLWLHVSCSRNDRLPSWEDLRVVKDLFIGKDKLALQILPPEEEYININPNVLHLFHCRDSRPVPDFRAFHNGIAEL